MIRNRTCNPKGGSGNNIPLDLQNEFLNRVFKDDITQRSIDRSSQSAKRAHDTLENFDIATRVHQDKGQHIPPDTTEDFHLILHVLLDEKVFTVVPGRAHECISTDQVKKNLKSLHKWLQHHRKCAIMEQALMQNKF
jgi:hypothetical protein